MKIKKFDSRLYKKYDNKAKQYAIKLLNKNNIVATENIDKKGVDLIAQNGKKTFYVETEIKLAINNKKFLYDTVRLTFRKSKYCQLDKPTLFILFSKTGSKYFCIWSDTVLASPIVKINNKYMEKEMFYDIPIEKTFTDIKRAIT